MFGNFFPENRAVYEKIWKYIVEWDKPQMAIWRLRIACWITKATNTHSQYAILIAFPQQQRLHERASMLELVRNLMAHAQKPHFVFRLKGRVHLNRWGSQFSRLPAAELCASAAAMLDTPYSEVVWRILATHSIRQFPLHIPSRASPCATTFRTQYTLHAHCVSCLKKFRILNAYESEYSVSLRRVCNTRHTIQRAFSR